MNIHSAIIKGPRKERLQDALGIINQQYFTLLIVADGLGSAEHSDFGAKQAIVAVEKAVHQWRKLEKKDHKVLIQLIHFFWNLLIGDSEYEKKDCLTTCLFAYLDKTDQHIILGQLGDGLLFFESKGETLHVKSSDDYNYTKSLGSSRSFNDWNIRSVHYDTNAFTLLMTTDGVSEDLVEHKEHEFAASLIREMLKLKKNKRNNYLKQLLENWPTKFHTDDKTICIAWEKKRS
jgi:serine/threonine protein phosphatase PrpC